MHRHRLFTLSTALIGVLACAVRLSAEDTSAVPEPELEKGERLTEMKRQAGEYELRLSRGRDEDLLLHPEPLLRFDNPVGGVPDGIVVLWKDGKRPAVFAQVFQTSEKLWVHECQSLASAALEMRRDGKVVWQPAAASSEFRVLDEGPELADTATKRLGQFRELAKQFSAADDFKVRSGDAETTRHELRLLPTPVYRYAAADAGIDDGAVFAFVHGTDPELFLVLEHRAAGESAGWHYALAPMTCWAVEAKRNGKAVWNVPERLGKSRPSHDYHVWIYRPEPNR